MTQLSVKDAYGIVQGNKNRYTWDEWPPALVPIVRQMIERTKQEVGGDPRAIEATLNGAAWMVQMFHIHGLDVNESMDMAKWIEGNLKANLGDMTGLKLGPDDMIRLGIGGGLYTGLWVGLLIGESRR